MKRVLLAALVAVALAPASAMAEYVCRANYFGHVPSTTPGRMKVRLSTGASCTGTIRTLWFCDNRFPGGAASVCAVDGLRYDREELLAIFQQVVRAADSQQVLFASTTTCADGTAGCGYAVDFGE